jgi:Na+/melibiose symporter-like transporter
MSTKQSSTIINRFSYGLGAFGYGSTGQALGSFLMFFGTSILAIPGTLMGIAVGVSTVWDAATDPIVGHMSDNTRSKSLGKRHGFILFAAIAVAIINVMIWSINPAWSTMSKFFVLLILLLVLETFNTGYSTPYSALGMDMSKSYNERTAIQGFKTTFSFLSLLVPSLLMTLFLSPSEFITMNASTRGYVSISYITSALCIICGVICFAGTLRFKKPADPLPPLARKSRMRDIFADFFSIVKQRNVARLITGYAVSLSAGAFITALGFHVFTYSFHFTTLEVPIIMFCFIAGIIAGQPIWYYVSKKYDKVTALILALGTVLLGIVIFSAVFILRNNIESNQILTLVALTILVCGAGTGALHSLPISMFADLITKFNAERGRDDTAKATGFLTFCTKISNAFIMFVIGVSLDLIGFRGHSPIQTLATQDWLGYLLIAGVTIACVSAVFIYSKYNYNKSDFDK